ncbi:MAG: glycosyltransferase [Dehalococcoidia bacterium]|nr:glycosyltransferase [Dehalococcoidia bacterium]
MYAGLLNADRGLSILYETARQVHEQHPEAEFHVYGPVEWQGIDATTRALGEDDWATVGVRFRGSVPFDEVGPALAGGMVGWLPRSPDEPNNLLAWPNKLVEYMAAGLAIVASDLPLQARVVGESESGIVVEAMSPGGHAAAICHLLEDAEARSRLGTNGKTAARTRYTWETEALKLRTLYAELGEAKPLIR